MKLDSEAFFAHFFSENATHIVWLVVPALLAIYRARAVDRRKLPIILTGVIDVLLLVAVALSFASCVHRAWTLSHQNTQAAGIGISIYILLAIANVWTAIRMGNSFRHKAAVLRLGFHSVNNINKTEGALKQTAQLSDEVDVEVKRLQDRWQETVFAHNLYRTVLQGSFDAGEIDADEHARRLREISALDSKVAEDILKTFSRLMELRAKVSGATKEAEELTEEIAESIATISRIRPGYLHPDQIVLKRRNKDRTTEAEAYGDADMRKPLDIDIKEPA